MSDPGDRYASPEMMRRAMRPEPMRPEPGNWQTCKCGAIGTQFFEPGVCSRCFFGGLPQYSPSPEFMLR